MQITTVVGIVVAAVIVLLGLILIFRKPHDAAPSLDAELQFNPATQLPIIPRHVRDQLQLAHETVAEGDVATAATQEVHDATAPSAEPTSTEPASQVPVSPSTADVALDSAISPEMKNEIIDHTTESSSVLVSAATDVQHKADATGQDISVQAGEPATTTAEQTAATVSTPVTEAVDVAAFQLNPNIETAEIEEFDEESSILDKHLHEQRRFDDESTLANAETLIALNVYPNPRRALSGDKTLKLLLKYGLRFGELSCFHRYEHTEEVSPLMFSVLRMTEEGPTGFDLESLSGEQVQGLAFFLALPHSNVQKGFDTMVSIAGLIAREIDGAVYDENNLEFTPQLKEHWRHKAIDYRSGQQL